MTDEDSLIKVMVDELNAILKYHELTNSMTCPKATDIVSSITDEEIVHFGEALYMLKKLNPKWVELVSKGEQEAHDLVHTPTSLITDMPSA